jgi:hypothetical protein
MHSTFTKRVVASLVCFAFLALIVPGAVHAEKKAAKSDAQTWASKQLTTLYALFPFLAGLLKLGLPGLPAKEMPKKSGNTPTLGARPTGDLPPGQPSDGD